GDTVYVPANTQVYVVMGEAKQTGAFPYPLAGKVTVMQAYTQVGGKSPQSDLKNSQIIRFTPEGNPTRTPIDLAKLTDDKKPSGVNPVLEPGDILYIPSRSTRKGFDWGNLLTPLSALSLL